MSGLIHIYCGDGKGKTTAAMGLAVRCAGSGRKVLLVQFLKDGKSSEFASLARVPDIEVIPQTRVFGFSWTLTPEEKAEAGRYYTALLEGKPEGLEVVLTGRGPSQALQDRADYVTEMRMVKHPFERGVPAREGIEF